MLICQSVPSHYLSTYLLPLTGEPRSLWRCVGNLIAHNGIICVTYSGSLSPIKFIIPLIPASQGDYFSKLYGPAFIQLLVNYSSTHTSPSLSAKKEEDGNLSSLIQKLVQLCHKMWWTMTTVDLDSIMTIYDRLLIPCQRSCAGMKAFRNCFLEHNSPIVFVLCDKSPVVLLLLPVSPSSSL